MVAGLYVGPAIGSAESEVGLSRPWSITPSVVDTPDYLFTPDRQAFFAHRGWIVIDRLDHRGVDVSVMELRL